MKRRSAERHVWSFFVNSLIGKANRKQGIAAYGNRFHSVDDHMYSFRYTEVGNISLRVPQFYGARHSYFCHARWNNLTNVMTRRENILFGRFIIFSKLAKDAKKILEWRRILNRKRSLRDLTSLTTSVVVFVEDRTIEDRTGSKRKKGGMIFIERATVRMRWCWKRTPPARPRRVQASLTTSALRFSTVWRSERRGAE